MKASTLTTTPRSHERPKRRASVNRLEVDVNRPTDFNTDDLSPPQSGFRKSLCERYGPDTTTAFRNLEKAQFKLCREQNSLTFLMRCRDNNIIPKGLKVNVPQSSQRARRICTRASLALVREQIDHHRHQKRVTMDKITHIKSYLQTRLGQVDYQRLENAVSRSSNHYNRQIKQRQTQKFQRLKEEQQPQRRPPIQGVVVNKSSRVLTSAESELLSKGLNYAIRPKKVPLMDIVASIEAATTKLSVADRDTVRVKCRETLTKSKMPRPNLNRNEQIALRGLSRDENIVILPADKGNATVVLDKEDYTSKMADLLSRGEYKEIKNDKTKTVERKIKALLKTVEASLPRETFHKLNPNNTKAPHMYGKPKIHKPDMPMRPIISNIGSPCHQLARFLNNIISPLVGKTDSYVKDSKHFVTMLTTVNIAPNDIMVSFDVESLFTSVPTSEVLPLLRSRLESDQTPSEESGLSVDSILELVSFCVNTSYFQFGEKFYEQTQGMAMGSPLSPVLANLYMEWFEQTALSSTNKPPKMWKRYVDDTFTIFNHDTDLAKFLDHLNSIAPSIRFTMELENNNSLPFLDVLVTKEESGLTTSVYYKKTHTGRYLDYNSNHTKGVKTGILKCLATRSKEICSPTTLQAEMKNLVETFKMNGYPEDLIKSALTSQRQDTVEDERPLQTLCLPYIPGTSEKLGRICKEFKIRTVYRSSDTLGRRLTKVKPRTDMGKKKNVIYKIPCECGDSYIGETLRPLDARIAEHKRCCREGNSSSGVAEHMWSKQHNIKWDDIKILDNESGWTKRKIKEALYMKLQGNVFSQPSKQPSETWLPLLKKV